MNEEVVIYGTGGLGRVALDVVEDMNCAFPRFRIVGFIDDSPELLGCCINGYSVLGGIEWLAERSGLGVIIAIGSGLARRRIVEKLNRLGTHNFPSVFHSTTRLSSHARIGIGAILGPYSVVQANAIVGQFVYMSSSSTIGHDSQIGDFVSVAPSVCIVGGGIVGEGTELGAGCVVLPSAPVGRWVQVGANATVTKKVSDMSVVVGTPAKVIRTRNIDL